jgi:hypothetical protein
MNGSSTLTEGIPDALYFTLYLSLTRYFSYQTTEKAGFKLPQVGSLKPAPLQSRTETKFLIYGSGNFRAPALL